MLTTLLIASLMALAAPAENDVRLAASCRREAGERIAKGPEEGREAMDSAVAECLRQALREHDAVLERVPGARRRLRAIDEYPPSSIRRTREIDGVEMQVYPPGSVDTVAGPQERRIGEHELRWDQAVMQQLPGSV